MISKKVNKEEKTSIRRRRRFKLKSSLKTIEKDSIEKKKATFIFIQKVINKKE